MSKKGFFFLIYVIYKSISILQHLFNFFKYIKLRLVKPLSNLYFDVVKILLLTVYYTLAATPLEASRGT